MMDQDDETFESEGVVTPSKLRFCDELELIEDTPEKPTVL